jgi:hypothetical protein
VAIQIFRATGKCLPRGDRLCCGAKRWCPATGFSIDLPGLVTAQVTENDVPGVVELLENPRDAGEHLEGGLSRVASDGFARGVALVNRQAHPQFRNLMLQDEQYLVRRARKRLLRAENLVEMRIVAIGYVSFNGNLDALRSWVTGERLLM